MRLSILPIITCLAACGPAEPSAVQDPHRGTEAPASFPLVVGQAGADDIGLFLAGMPVRRGAGLSALQQTEEYQEHRREIMAVWAGSRSRLNVMRSWSFSQLAPTIGTCDTVLYPFGGPDLLHVSALFPQARTYVLIGQEPAGEVPALEAMPPGEVLAVLAAFRQATRTQLECGYFITQDMRSDLQRGALRGVTPILLSAVALSGGRVDSVNGLSVGGKRGVDMRFSDAAGMAHRACYVEGDLSNSGFKGGLRQWLGGLGGDITYFKAASYLMHDNRFSQSREFLITQSRVVLQDDSGIPFRWFRQGWTQRFFGSYETPIELFVSHQQNDLRQAYATQPTSPLPFGSGYRVSRLEGNLLLAIKHQAPTPLPVALNTPGID